MTKKFKKLLTKIFRYLSSGGLGIATEYLIIFLLVEFVGIYYLLGETFATIGGTTLNFIIQRKWTFKAKNNLLSSSLKYASVWFLNYTFTMGFMYVTVEYFNWHYILSKTVALFFIIVWNYFLYKNYVYK